MHLKEKKNKNSCRMNKISIKKPYDLGQKDTCK